MGMKIFLFFLWTNGMKFGRIIKEMLFAKGTVKNLVKAAIFDFDGTLANTLPDLKITLNLTRNE